MGTAARARPHSSCPQAGAAADAGEWPAVTAPPNGVAERFFRTFKEQVVHGRIYQTIDDVRAAVRKFFELYNAQWLIEKNGLRSPRQTRFAWEKANMKHAA